MLNNTLDDNIISETRKGQFQVTVFERNGIRYLSLARKKRYEKNWYGLPIRQVAVSEWKDDVMNLYISNLLNMVAER